MVNMVMIVTHLLVPVALRVAGALGLAAEPALALVPPAAQAHRLVVRHLALRVGPAVRDGAGVPALAVDAGLAEGALLIGPAAGHAGAPHAAHAVLAVPVRRAPLLAAALRTLLAAAAVRRSPAAGCAESARALGPGRARRLDSG